MRQRTPNSKFCQRCRCYKERSQFEVIKVKFGYRKDQLCFVCRKNKNDEIAARPKRKSPIPTRWRLTQSRKNELAAIPDPFTKTETVVPEILNYHWLAVV